MSCRYRSFGFPSKGSVANMSDVPIPGLRWLHALALCWNPGLTYTGKPWTGRGWAGSICFRQPPLGSSSHWSDTVVPAAPPVLGSAPATSPRPRGSPCTRRDRHTVKLTATRSVVAALAANFSTVAVSPWERTLPKSGLLFPNLVSMATSSPKPYSIKWG
jgi:hypothetical protein